MNLSDLLTNMFGFIFLALFFGLIIFFVVTGRRRQRRRYLRDVSAFTKLRRGIGLAVEAGQRLHISLGNGGIISPHGASSLVGLSMLQRN